MEKEIEEVTEVTEVAEVSANKEITELSKNPFESTSSFKTYWSMAKYLASSDMIPQNYQNKPMNVVIALEQAQRMNCSPLMVMQQLYVVKGKPTWSGQACSMIVNGCGKFENVDLVYVGKEGEESYGAYVEATRKSDGKRVKGTTVDMKMAKLEGWTSNTKWKSMPNQMLAYRAYSFFARVFCPSELSGFSTEGEIEDSEAKPNRRTTVDNPFADDGK